MRCCFLQYSRFLVPLTHVLNRFQGQLHRATAQMCQHADRDCLIVAEGGFDARDSRFEARTDADGGGAAG